MLPADIAVQGFPPRGLGPWYWLLRVGRCFWLRAGMRRVAAHGTIRATFPIVVRAWVAALACVGHVWILGSILGRLQGDRVFDKVPIISLAVVERGEHDEQRTGRT